MCCQKRAFNPYFQVFPAWEARAWEGVGQYSLMGREERTKEGKKLGWRGGGGAGGGHRQFPEETQAVKGVKRPP